MKTHFLAAIFLSVPLLHAGGIFQLNELDRHLIEQGWGEAGVNQSVDGGPITMDGKTYAKGIGTHADSAIELTLDGRANQFTAVVGASDRQKGTTSSVSFVVRGDGKILWSSGKMTPDTAPKPISIRLAGVKRLQLSVDDAGDGIAYDHANWADASISFDGAPPHSSRETFTVTTDDLAINFEVAKGGILTVNSFGAIDGSWKTPFTGPLFPGMSDSGYHQPPVSITRSNGDSTLSLIYQSHTTEDLAEGVKETIITLKDNVLPILVDIHFRQFSHENVIQQWAVLRNDLTDPIHVNHLDSAYWQAPATAAPHIEWYDSRWADEAPRPNFEKISKGRRVIENLTGNRHIEAPLPAFVMSFGAFPNEESSPCLLASLAWSGSMAMTFDHDNKEIFAASIGVRSQTGSYLLPPSERLTTPPCVFTYSSHGKGEASRNLHRWTRKYGMRDGNRIRLIDNNSWEGCAFNVKEDTVVEMIKGSADLGIELYVLDDGWFGNGPTARTGDASGLGDWEINRERFPNGLPRLVQAAKDSNISFGLWFEPEMVNPRSELFAKYPDWVLRSPDRELKLERNQAVLDLTNPAVRDFVFQTVDRALSANPEMRFIKWDCNSSIHNPYAPNLGPDRQGELVWRYLENYYAIQKQLVEKHPNVDFQACSSGGGRADHGAMLSSHTFWVSDNTNPLFRLRAQWNISTFLPPIAATCHVTHTGDFKPKFRFDVSMMGQLGLEVDPRRAEPEFQNAAKTGIAAYKKVRDIVQFGKQYRHASPFETTMPSLNYVSNDGNRALILAYQTGTIQGAVETVVHVRGLEPKKIYNLTEINLPIGDDYPRLSKAPKRSAPGEFWMNEGIPLTFHRSNDSASLVLEATH